MNKWMNKWTNKPINFLLVIVASKQKKKLSKIALRTIYLKSQKRSLRLKELKNSHIMGLCGKKKPITEMP